MRILIIDNYDSFTFNLYQHVGEILETRPESPGTVDVCRNDELSLEQIKNREYSKIIISPGPGHPADPAYFGVCREVLLELGMRIPILGVCLGMQGFAHHFGGSIGLASIPMHGKTSVIKHDGTGIFQGLPQYIEVMRYHSLIVNSLPEEISIIARSTDDAGEIMAIRHAHHPITGIQFHPESFATEGGKSILENFLFHME